MSNEDLLKRLVRFEGKTCVSSDDDVLAAEAIERLTRERDEWKGTAEHLLDIEREWIDANESLAAGAKLIEARAEAAERKVEKLREALEPFAGLDLRGAGVDKDEWTIWIKDLRAARAALAETEDSHE